MTETLIERACRVAEVLVWTMEKRIMYYQTRLKDAEAMYTRGTGTMEPVENYAKKVGNIQTDLDDLRETIDQFNVTVAESGLPDKEYDTNRRKLARTILGYNKSYGEL